MQQDDKSTPRPLQQQQASQHGDRQQQQAGSTEFQQKPGAQPGGSQVEGEGSYSATRNYQKDIGEYMQNADIDKNAEASKPRSEQEARELEQAEREGKSHSKGEH